MALGRDGVLEGERLDVAPMFYAVGCVNACVSLSLPCFICCVLETYHCQRPIHSLQAAPLFCSLMFHTNMRFPHFMDFIF